MSKWRRRLFGNFYFYQLFPEEGPAMVEVGPAGMFSGKDVSLEIWTDPRTGKPWKSMKAPREWYDLAVEATTAEWLPSKPKED